MYANPPGLLHWLLVIALAVLPLRAVPAAQRHCDMDGGARVMVDHSRHSAGMMQHRVDDATHMGDHKHGCCCCHGKASCSPECGIGLHAAAIMQSVPVLSSIYLQQRLAETSDSLHTRVLTPPSRPPLTLPV